MMVNRNENRTLSWSELPEGFKKLLRRSYEEYKEVLYDPSLHPVARKIPSWESWLHKHDILLDQGEHISF